MRATRHATAVAAIVAAVACGGGDAGELDRRDVAVAATPTASAHGPNTVTIINRPDNRHSGLYIPDRLTVPTGTTVTFHNDDDVLPHTVTAGTPDASTPDLFDSEILGSDGAAWSHTFNEPGTFPYWCAIHPDMTGTVTVTG